MLTIVGSYISPYVRKVLVCLDIKGIPYEIDPIVPFYGNDDFARISPLRRIPVLLDGELAIPDSTIICEFLEECYPQPALYPTDPAQRARARWLEEYADSRMGEVFIWRFFNQLTIRRFVWGETPDPEVVKKSRGVEIPDILRHLETQLPEAGYLFGDICVADIAIAAFFRNIDLARAEIDMSAAPRTAAFVARLHQHPAFARLRRFEELAAGTPIAQHREALAGAGAPVSQATYFNPEPRRGVMQI